MNHVHQHLTHTSATPMQGMAEVLQQLAQQLPQAKVVGTLLQSVCRVHTDTRSLQEGDLFVALRGERFDAHSFLPQARAQGAVAAVAESGLVQAGLAGVEVPDSRLALGQLAKLWRRQHYLPLIAVTGSNGKTTVTQMIASILRAAVQNADTQVLATQGNLNNDIGLPLTLLRLRPEHQLGVVELGMNHVGEIAYLADLALPQVALVNNAQREHQEFMHTVEAVARENGSVIAALPADGIAVFPADDVYTPLWKKLAGGRTCLRFALQANADSYADIYASSMQWQGDHWTVQAQTPRGAHSFHLRVPGKHNVKNALAAATCAHAAGVRWEHIVAGLNAFEPVQGRSRVVRVAWQGKTLTLVDDCYNANPDSVRAAIDLLRELPAPQVLVLGDMGEVGEQGEAFHAEAGGYAADQGITHLITLGRLAQHSAERHPQAQHSGNTAQDWRQVWQQLEPLLATAGSVLVKGSRFMEMEKIVQALLQTAGAWSAEQQKQEEKIPPQTMQERTYQTTAQQADTPQAGREELC